MNNNASVTPVKLDTFIAKAEAGGVLLTWHSVSEYQNAGYFVCDNDGWYGKLEQGQQHV